MTLTPKVVGLNSCPQYRSRPGDCHAEKTRNGETASHAWWSHFTQGYERPRPEPFSVPRETPKCVADYGTTVLQMAVSPVSKASKKTTSSGDVTYQTSLQSVAQP